MIKNMIQEIIDFLNTYIKAHGCTEMNKWVEFLEQLGWHPGSEPPVFDEFDDDKEVIGIWTHQNSSAYFVTIPYNVVNYVQYENGKWLYDGFSVPVKYWYYLPKDD